ncbi:MAG: hypothetical protein KKF41_11125 [Actinobacteria bacterium]|nr:hypothetical protein [Actinomycetota bacterium]MBU1944948.1 hypothetical protein [Actinomycetota bacterium]MBU2688126.1 hypothetical protein [Actinomycetota bacterium]
MDGVTIVIIIAAVAAAAFVCLLVLYLALLGGKRTESASIEPGGASRVDAELDFQFGDIEVSGGSSGLLEAEFTSNVRGFHPEVRYSTSGGEGRLEVKGKPPSWIAGWLGRTRGTLRFDGSVPLNLDVDLGKGNGDFHIGGLALEKVEIEALAGRVDVDAPGEMRLLEEVEIENSAGDISLAMPGRYPAMRSLQVKNSAGNTRVSLLGGWSRDLDCRISSAAGEVRIELPTDVGVSVEVKSSVGDVKAKGMTRTPEGAFTNSALGKADVTLRLFVKNTAGEINLVTAPRVSA